MSDNTIRILVTGKNGSLSVAVSEYLQQKADCSAKRISVRDDAFPGVDFTTADVVVHIAGVTPQNIKSPQDYETVNVQLTKKLANRCKQDGVKQFIYISSMAVYGAAQSMDCEKGTITADTLPNPVTDYGKSKYAAEKTIETLRDQRFSVAIIRVPSIYGKGKTEYIDQYRYLSEKLPFIPAAFEEHKKSAICTENLCELIYLMIVNKADGIVCPDDGPYSTVDFCTAIHPQKKKNRLFGKLMELFLKNNSRILDYYGTICYSQEIASVYDGKYRVKDFKEAIRLSYEE